MKKLHFIAVAFLFSLFASGQDLKIEVEGIANLSGAVANIAEAGENIAGSLESENAVFVSVLNSDYWAKKNNNNRKWRIFVHKTDLTWNNTLQLEVKRSGNGYKPESNGSPLLQDGENYLDISNTPTYFFKGKNEVAYIPIDVKVSGLSLTLGAKQYETNIVITVYDDW